MPGTPSRQDTRHAPGRPRTSKAWRSESPGVECPGNHRLRLQTATPQPPDDAPCFLGAPAIEHGANIVGGSRMRTPMPAHQQIKVVPGPASANGADALPIQGRSEIVIGGHTGRAQLVEQEAEVRRRRHGDAVRSSHGVSWVEFRPSTVAHIKYGDCGGDLRGPRRGGPIATHIG